MDELVQPDSPLSIWSGSITPPLEESANYLDSEEFLMSQCIVNIEKDHGTDAESQGDVVFLSCHEQHFGADFNPNGYLKSGVLKRIFNQELPYEFMSKRCGNEFDEVPLVCSNYRKLIFAMRQTLQDALISKRQRKNNRHGLDSFSWNDISTLKPVIDNLKCLSAMLHFWIHRLASVDENQFMESPTRINYGDLNRNILEEYSRLVKFVRSLYRRHCLAISYNVSKDGMLHIYLNIALYYQIMHLCNLRRENGNYSELGRISALMMEDIINLAHKRFTQDLELETLFKSSPFPCYCVKEVAVTTVLLRSKVKELQDVYRVSSTTPVTIMGQDNLDLNMTTIEWIQEIFDRITQSDCSSNKRMVSYTTRDGADFDNFSLWILKNITCLQSINELGVDIGPIKMPYFGRWSGIETILRNMFEKREQENSFKRRKGKEILRYSLFFMENWTTPPRDFILLLWDNMQKHLDSSFSPAASTISSTWTPSFTPWQWVNKCKEYTTLSGIENDSVFDLFLRNLAQFIATSAYHHTNAGWDHVKARFYSKFYRKRIQEFGENGLYNFATMFLMLVWVTKQEDPGKKMANLLSLVVPDTTAKQELILKAYFSLLYTFREIKKDTSTINSKLAEKFLDICRIQKDLPFKSQKRYEHSRLISFYLNSVETMIDGPLPLGSDVALIKCDEAFSLLLEHSTNLEFQKVVDFIQAVLSSKYVSSSHNPQFKELALALTEKIYPGFEKNVERRLKETILINGIADLSASFTSLAVQCSTVDVSVPIKCEDLLKFYLKDGHNSRFTTRYFSQVLESAANVERIVDLELEGIFINVWIRMSLKPSVESQSISEITRAVLKLPAVNQLLKSEVINDAKTHDKVILSFIGALGAGFDALTLLKDVVDFKRKLNVYLNGIDKCFQTIVNAASTSTHTRFSYLLCGKMIKCLNKAIYSKTVPDCLLPKLLDIMILPLMPSSKQLDPIITRNVTINLHQVLLGLASLDFIRDDFVKRKIKEIFTRYFIATTERCRNSNAAVNPFMVSIKGSLTANPSKDMSDFRYHVVQLLAQNFLILSQPPTKLSVALHFLQDMFQKTQVDREIHRDGPVILKQVLGCLIACDGCSKEEEPLGIRNHALSILTVVSRCLSSSDAASRNELISRFKDFLTSNISQFQATIFKTFGSIAALFPGIMGELHEFILDAISKEEKKSGPEKGQSLRYHYETLVRLPTLERLS